MHVHLQLILPHARADVGYAQNLLLEERLSVSGIMRVVSWNINGLRAVLKKSGKTLKQLLDSLQADVICLQETKATSECYCF